MHTVTWLFLLDLLWCLELKSVIQGSLHAQQWEFSNYLLNERKQNILRQDARSAWSWVWLEPASRGFPGADSIVLFLHFCISKYRLTLSLFPWERGLSVCCC